MLYFGGGGKEGRCLSARRREAGSERARSSVGFEAREEAETSEKRQRDEGRRMMQKEMVYIRVERDFDGARPANFGAR